MKTQPHGFPLASFEVLCAQTAMFINGKTACLGKGALGEQAEQRGRAPALSPRNETAAAQILTSSGSVVSADNQPDLLYLKGLLCLDFG